MPKRALAGKKTDITLDPASSIPLYRQIYDRLRTAILSGQLEPGQRLPATRTLASQLGISRNTVNIAYEQLLMEGYIESRVGRGTSVAQVIPETLLAVHSAELVPQPDQRAALPQAISLIGRKMVQISGSPGLWATSGEGKPRAFSMGVPDLALFPYQIWARLIARHARHSLPDVSHYQDSAGYAPLREAIAAHIGLTRGVRCTMDQVIVVAGSQGALDLSARILLNPGDVAWIEDPGYPGAYGALQAAGAHIAPVPVAADGIDVSARRSCYPQARLAYVTPSHQYPLGVTMGLARRLSLLEWASQANAWILEDDYDSEYRFSGRPLEALQGLDRANRVIYIGTFSKVLFPSLRLGYLVVPSNLIDVFLAARYFVDRHAPILEQMALTDFITQGHFMGHLRRMRAIYAERREALVTALESELGALFEPHVPEAGMHLAGWLPPDIDDMRAAQQAAIYGVDVNPISAISTGSLQRGGLMLGYAAVNEREIHNGVQRLATALRSMMHSQQKG